MLVALDHVVVDATRETLHSSPFIAMSLDEATDVASEQRISIHAHYVHNFERKPVLLDLCEVTGSATAENITAALIEVVTKYGMDNKFLAERLICVGADGASVMAGNKNGLGVALATEYAPYMVMIHCHNHKLALASKVLSTDGLVGDAENLVKSIYSFFSHSAKRARELAKAAETEQIKACKVLRPVSTRWLSLENALNNALRLYPALIAKISEDADALIPEAVYLTRQLLDLDNMLGLALIQPLLVSLQRLSKTFQKREIFLMDMKKAKDLCIDEIKQLYLSKDSFKVDVICKSLPAYHSLAYAESSPLQFGKTGRATHLEFQTTDQAYHVTVTPRGPGRSLPTLVTNEDLECAIKRVQSGAMDAATKVINAIKERFPNDEMLDAGSVVYLQYWAGCPSRADFDAKLDTLLKHYGVHKSILGKDGKSHQVQPILDAEGLNGERCIVYGMLQRQGPSLSERFSDSPAPTTAMWRELTANKVVEVAIPHFLRVVNLVLCMVGGSVEEERTFSTMKFLKNERRNRLSNHLAACCRVYSQAFFSLETLPFDRLYTCWKDAKHRKWNVA